jgi:hypothetical protein
LCCVGFVNSIGVVVVAYFSSTASHIIHCCKLLLRRRIGLLKFSRTTTT